MKKSEPPERIKVLFLVPSLRRAGAERQVVDLANGLDPGRYEKHLACFGPPLDLLAEVDGSTVEVHVLERRRKLDLALVRQVARIVDLHAIDVVHCTLQVSLFFATLTAVVSHVRPQLVTALHTTLNRSYKDDVYDRVLYRYLLRRCARIIFVCRAQADHWAGRFPELGRAGAVIYNGVDADRYRPELHEAEGRALRRSLGITEAARVVTCIAGLRMEKGHDLLIQAFAQLTGAPYLVLAGDGPMRPAIEQLVRARRLEDRVLLLGEVSDVRPVLSASDLSVLASTAVETFSMAMLESMAMGVSVVVPDIGGLAEAIVPGETGELFPMGDMARLREALQRMLDDPEGLHSMGIKARESVRSRFSTAAMIEETSALLSALPGVARDGDWDR